MPTLRPTPTLTPRLVPNALHRSKQMSERVRLARAGARAGDLTVLSYCITEAKPSYVPEMFAILFVFAYIANFFNGRNKNDLIAQKW